MGFLDFWICLIEFHSWTPKIQKYKIPTLKKSKNPKTKNPKIQTFGNVHLALRVGLQSKFQRFGSLDVWIFGFLDYWFFGFLDFWISLIEFNSWNPKKQKSKNPKNQKIQKSSCPKIQKSKPLGGSLVSALPSTRAGGQERLLVFFRRARMA